MTDGIGRGLRSIWDYLRGNRVAAWGAAAMGLIVALNVIALAIRTLLGGPGGASSSSYATTSEGLAAYSELLERAGYDVVQQRVQLRNDPPSSDDVLIVIDGDLPRDEAAVVEDFVSSGGRLVAAGGVTSFWIDDVVANPPVLVPSSSQVGTPAVDLGVVKRIKMKGEGEWSSDGGGGEVAIKGQGNNSVMVTFDIGAGQVWLLADASPLKNDLLDEADNASLGLFLAGRPGTEVRFLETVHGYAADTGLGAIPRNWRWTLVGLSAACLCYMLARGRRLGPPEEVTRILPPARREYVDALAATLLKTGNRAESIAPVVAAARARVFRRAGLHVDADDESFLRAAQALGMTDGEIRALTQGVLDDYAVMAAGRALARLGGDT